MVYEPLEDKRMYRRAEAVADRVWEAVASWEWLAKKTVGEQLIRAADSIGANIAEAGGRFHPADVKKFLYYSRGSLREAKYWLRRAASRSLIAADFASALDHELEQLAREINAAIAFQKRRAGIPPDD